MITIDRLACLPRRWKPHDPKASQMRGRVKTSLKQNIIRTTRRYLSFPDLTMEGERFGG